MLLKNQEKLNSGYCIIENIILKYGRLVIFYLMEDWTEKYRPKSLDRIVGNEHAITELKRWANAWNHGNPGKRAVILSGSPGTGKTSSALALAKDYGWPVIELNTSDARNATKIRKVATFGAVNETFGNNGTFVSSHKGGRKLIVLDEADNLYEKIKYNGKNDMSDKGGKRAIIDTIKITKQPMILIVNDYYNLIKGSGENLKRTCKLIKFYNPYPNSIFGLLRRICDSEGITADLKVLKAISDRCKGDIRSAVNDLQSICFGKRQLDIQSLNVLGYRDKNKIIFDALRDIFKTRDIKNIKESVSNLNEDPNSVLLWIAENLPAEYKDTCDLVKGYDAISKADVFLGRTYRRQNYGLWSYACDIMNGGVATAKTHEYQNEKYAFPLWLRERKSSKSYRDTRDSIVEKMSGICHNSNRKSREFLSLYLINMLRNDIEFAVKIMHKFEFTESDMKYLLGENYSSELEKSIHTAKTDHKKQIENENESVIYNKKEKDKKENKQQSLFDF